MINLQAREFGTDRNPVDGLRPDNEIRHRLIFPSLREFETLQMGGINGAARARGLADPDRTAGRLGTEIHLGG